MLRRLPALLAVALLAVLLVACGDDETGGPQQPTAEVTLPLQQTADLREAAKAAGCEVRNPPEEGNDHIPREFKPSEYKSNPPTSGDHHPTPAEDGIYEPGETPALGMLVHTLEHGRIEVQYRPGTPQETIDQLEALLAETEGYHLLLFENKTGMKYAVAATAWNRLVGCPEMNNKVFDAIRTMRMRYLDKGPEQVP